MQNTTKDHAIIHELFDLTGKVALITGSSQGLGFVLAHGLGQAGATLVLNGRNKEKLDRAVVKLSEEGLSVHGYAFDVTDSTQIQQSIPKVEQEVGPIDILVNNAGIQKRAPLDIQMRSAVGKNSPTCRAGKVV